MNSEYALTGKEHICYKCNKLAHDDEDMLCLLCRREESWTDAHELSRAMSDVVKRYKQFEGLSDAGGIAAFKTDVRVNIAKIRESDPILYNILFVLGDA